MTFEVKDELLQNSQMPVLHKYDNIGGTDEEDEQEEIDGQESESPLSRANIKESEASVEDKEDNEETEELKIENIRGCCPICDIWDSQENIRKHAVKHFELELKELVKDRETDDVCPNCPWDFSLALDHLALEHGWIDKLLKDQSMIEKKRKELKSGESLETDPRFAGSIQNIFYCDLCDIAFISEEFVTEHIRKYHKILKKDFKQFVSDHCLWKYEFK